jgi:hypothetical protein
VAEREGWKIIRPAVATVVAVVAVAATVAVMAADRVMALGRYKLI